MNAPGSLGDRVCLVTGAGRGIGQAAARVLAAAEARVVVADISDSGAAVVEEIKEAGGKACFVQADVSTDAGAQTSVAETLSTFGQLDSLVNNAGILRLADSFEMTTDTQLADMMRINFESVFRLSKAALPALEASGRGSIVNTASMVGHRIGMPSHAVYGASKAAVVEEFLKEHSEEELRAGGDSTLAAIPIGTYASPEQIGDVIGFLASDASSYVTGQTILIDGGFTGI